MEDDGKTLEQLDDAETRPGTGKTEKASWHLKPGESFGRYTILSRLGAGGMGIVYSAYDPELDRKIALKLLLPSRSDPSAQERLIREAQAMARISHPNVVTVHDVGDIEDRAFIAMEFVEGQSLDQWLASENRGHREILDVFLQAGRGIAAAHRADLIHRDFKSANVLIGTDGRVRVADFGLARFTQAEEIDAEIMDSEKTEVTPHNNGSSRPQMGALTEPGTMVGTPRYMAPEQVLEGRASAASDQFSFCVALFEALNGELPYGKDNLRSVAHRALDGNITPFSPGSGLSKRGRRALLKGLKGREEERFSTMDELLTELQWDPAAARRKILLSASVVTLVSIPLAVFFIIHSMKFAPCKAGGEHWKKVWNTQRREELAASFQASGLPFAGKNFHLVSDHLDSLGKEWIETYTTLCEATRKRGEQSADLFNVQMLCLNKRLAEIDKTLDLLKRHDEDLIENSLEIIEALPRISHCAQNAQLLSLQTLPSDPSVVEKIKKLQEDHARAEALSFAGRYEEALDEIDRVTGEIKDIEYAPLLADCFRLRGHLEYQLGNPSDAEETLKNALIAAERGGDERNVILILDELVWVSGISQKEIDEAMFWSNLEDARITRIGEPEDPRARFLHTRAAIEQVAGKYEQALAHEMESLEAVLKLDGDLSLSTADAEDQLGNVLVSMARYDEALRYFNKALTIREQVLGPEHPDVATSLNNTALDYLERYGEALDVLHRALAIEEKIFGPESPKLATTLNNLAYSEEGAGRYEQALDTHDRGLDLIRKAWGPGDPQTAYALLNRCSVLKNSINFPEPSKMHGKQRKS